MYIEKVNVPLNLIRNGILRGQGDLFYQAAKTIRRVGPLESVLANNETMLANREESIYAI